MFFFFCFCYIFKRVGSTHTECPGIVQGAELVIFKVFSSKGQSLTSWLLEALQACQEEGVDIVNLSIGGLIY